MTLMTPKPHDEGDTEGFPYTYMTFPGNWPGAYQKLGKHSMGGISYFSREDFGDLVEHVEIRGQHFWYSFNWQQCEL